MSLKSKYEFRVKRTQRWKEPFQKQDSAGKWRLERTRDLLAAYRAQPTKAALAKFRESRVRLRASRARRKELLGSYNKSKALELTLHRQLDKQVKARLPVVSRYVVMLDGKPMALWIAREVLRIRKAGRWKGCVVSGWRSPAYCEQLCIAKCGSPSCPGTCGGKSSNHTGQKYPAGAVDVDIAHREVFAAECERLNSSLKNLLSNDRNHFSATGH